MNMNSRASEFGDCRLMLYYKGDISALTLFAQHGSGSVCFPGPLPLLSSALDAEQAQAQKIARHPALLVKAISEQMALPADLLLIESGFRELVDAPGGVITVYLARFDRLDPPHALMKTKDCMLKPLPALRGRPPAELELLRRAYVKVMEG